MKSKKCLFRRLQGSYNEWGLTVSRTSSLIRGVVLEEIFEKGFFAEGVLTEGVQHYAHCSSSKVPWSQSVERFQASPQSLCNTVYKLLSKILATIGLSRSSQSWPNQEAIVKGRHIGEGVSPMIRSILWTADHPRKRLPEA